MCQAFLIEIHASDLDNTYCYVFSNYLACLYKVVRNLLNYFFAFEEVNSLIFVDNVFFSKIEDIDIYEHVERQLFSKMFA